MAFGRSKCVVKNRVESTQYSTLYERMAKNLYYGERLENFVEKNLSLPLTSYASELFSTTHKGYSLNRLSSYNAGKIEADPCSLIMALIYLERLNAIDPSYVRRITPQELFIVSMMISTKFYIGYDEEIYLSDWAAEGNMSDNKLKRLELEFLSAIDWKIYISNEEFFEKLGNVEKILAHREGLPRGWLTYTELVQILPSVMSTKNFLNALINHIAILTVSYAAGVLTILGAFFLASHIPGHLLHRENKTAANSSSPDTLSGNLTNPIQNELKSSSIALIVQEHNATCLALNAENELLKLERQYQKEHEELELRQRNSEIDYRALDLISPLIKFKSPLRDWNWKKPEHKWLALKDVYSDRCNSKNDIDRSRNYQKSRNVIHASMQHLKTFFGNETVNILWQILADSSQPSYVRLPVVWFKFI